MSSVIINSGANAASSTLSAVLSKTGVPSTPNNVNPFRSEVLHWYRKCLKAAFDVEWKSDGDALYVLEETRKLFRQNENILDPARIRRKLEEVEMRYGLAVHYKIPYPRMFHKTSGNTPDSLGAYAAYLDSHYDYNNCAVHPDMAVERESPNGMVLGESHAGPSMHRDDA